MWAGALPLVRTNWPIMRLTISLAGMLVMITAHYGSQSCKPAVFFSTRSIEPIHNFRHRLYYIHCRKGRGWLTRLSKFQSEIGMEPRNQTISPMMAGSDASSFNERILVTQRPNFFELVAQEAMNEALGPALEYACKVLWHHL